jgi:DNA replication and repair protein RecF
MWLQSLTLNRYRNLEPLVLEPSEGLNVLVGSNAQGKTNLLEAIYVCCVGRSHQTVRDRELIRWGEETASLMVDCRHRDGPHRVEVRLTLSGRKMVRINGHPVHRLGELMGHMNAVIFSPAELSLVRDGPSCRRRFIDIAMSQIRPAYFYTLQRYQHALAQRNALLRAIAAGGGGRDTLPVWEAQLARSGARLIVARRDFCDRLSQRAAGIHERLSGGEKLLAVYEASARSGDVPDLEAELQAGMMNGRDADIRRGATSLGPHRDDLALTLDGRDIRAFGSQGQKRTCALSLKLAEREMMREETGEEPLLLLDDVLSELDEDRRRMLLSHIENTQVFITCVNAEQAPALYRRSARVYDVEAGRVSVRSS